MNKILNMSLGPVWMNLSMNISKRKVKEKDDSKCFL